VKADNWAGGVQYDPATRDRDEIIPAGTEAAVRSREAFPAASVTTHSAEEACELVLAHGGASLPRRDPVDARVIDSVRTGKPSFGAGIVNTPDDVGGWPEYKAAELPADSDRDGQSDVWEKANGLNPADAADAMLDGDRDGYVNIEEFLNGTDPRKFVDYARPENNRCALHNRPPAK
jgi:hypothetical protein